MKELLDKAIAFHGHKCPGIAIGVRAAIEAKRILGIEDVYRKGIYCVAEQLGCYDDGIQTVMNCTTGNGNLIYRPTGKCVFSFFDLKSGRSVRLAKLPGGKGSNTDEKIEHIMTAPLEEIFSVGEVIIPTPVKPKKYARRICDCCGEEVTEDMLRVRGEKAVCLDCAEKL